MGAEAKFAEAARALGDAMLSRGIGLVYGGAHRGLMGVLADAVLAGGGEVLGVIPQSLVDLEIAHRGLTKLFVVSSMHERKALMAKHADAFAAMPGGFGTLDELMEIVTWRGLGLHDKPIGLLDVDGYFEGLLEFAAHMVRSGFVREEEVRRLVVSGSAEELLMRLFG
jgi:uncharacterized protein (TIGR00730 family)